MSAKFEFVTYDTISSAITGYCSQHSSIEEQWLIRALHDWCPLLKTINTDFLTKKSDDEYLFLVLAHLKGIVGLIAKETNENKENKTRFIPVKINGVPKQLPYPNSTAWTNLEGADPKVFFPLCIFLMLKTYLMVFYAPKDIHQHNAVDTEVVVFDGKFYNANFLLELIKEEALILVNATNILLNYSNILDIEDLAQRRQQLTSFVNSFLVNLKLYLTKSYNGKNDKQKRTQVCFPCGFKGHLMVLTLVRFEEETVLLRYDNLGDGIINHHVANGNSIYPFYLWEKNIEDLLSLQDFFEMLCAQKCNSDRDGAISEIYLKDNNNAKQNEIVKKWNNSALEKGITGQCVLISLTVGMHYRLVDYFDVFLHFMIISAINSSRLSQVGVLGDAQRLEVDTQEYLHALIAQNAINAMSQKNGFNSTQIPRHDDVVVRETVLRDVGLDAEYLQSLEDISFMDDVVDESKSFLTPTFLDKTTNKELEDFASLFKLVDDANKILRFLITSDMGSGKSLLSKRIAWSWANRREFGYFNWISGYDFVFRLSSQALFAYMTQDVDLAVIILEYCYNKEKIKHRNLRRELSEKKVLLLMDGIDEVRYVFGEGFNFQESIIYKIANDSSIHSIMMFSREPSPVFREISEEVGFVRELELLRFRDKDVKKYIRAFPGLSALEQNVILTLTYKSSVLRHFVALPLNLRILCTLFKTKQLIAGSPDLSDQRMLRPAKLYEMVLCERLKLIPQQLRENMRSFLMKLAWELKSTHNRNMLEYKQYRVMLIAFIGDSSCSAVEDFLLKTSLLTILKFGTGRRAEKFIYFVGGMIDFLAAEYWSLMLSLPDVKNEAIKAYQDYFLSDGHLNVWKLATYVVIRNGDRDVKKEFLLMITDAKNRNKAVSKHYVKLIYFINEYLMANEQLERLDNLMEEIMNYICGLIRNPVRKVYISLSNALNDNPYFTIRLIEFGLRDRKLENFLTIIVMLNIFRIGVVSDDIQNALTAQKCADDVNDRICDYLRQSYLSVLSDQVQCRAIQRIVSTLKKGEVNIFSDDIYGSAFVGLCKQAYEILVREVLNCFELSCEVNDQRLRLVKTLLVISSLSDPDHIMYFICKYIYIVKSRLVRTKIFALMSEDVVARWIEHMPDDAYEFSGLYQLITLIPTNAKVNLQVFDDGILCYGDGKTLAKSENEKFKAGVIRERAYLSFDEQNSLDLCYRELFQDPDGNTYTVIGYKYLNCPGYYLKLTPDPRNNNQNTQREASKLVVQLFNEYSKKCEKEPQRIYIELFDEFSMIVKKISNEADDDKVFVTFIEEFFINYKQGVKENKHCVLM